MKSICKKGLWVLILCSTTILLSAQNLDWRGYTLKAHYPLADNGQDKTGNYDSMSYGNHTFEDSSILSKGCRLNDTCLIETPQINALNDVAFAMKIDFKIKVYGGSIIQAGKGYRYLGLATTGTGNFGYKTASQQEHILNEITLNKDQWYTATILHNTTDSLTEVFLDNQKVAEMKQYLNHPSNDNIISNIDFSRGYAFNGHLRNLRVYTTNTLTSTRDNVFGQSQVKISPNPVSSHLNIEMLSSQNTSYSILDMSGRVLKSSTLTDNSVSVQSLEAGLYVFMIYQNGAVIHKEKFIKSE